MSRCLVTIRAIELETEMHASNYLVDPESTEANQTTSGTIERWITMGSGLTPVDCYVERLLHQMLTNEESKCTIRSGKGTDVTFTMKLLRIDGQNYYYEQTLPEMLTLAKRYKDNGVKMFPKYPRFAHAYFNRAAKCLLSWSPIDQLDAAIEGPGTVEELQSLLETLNLNIAACLIKDNRFEEVLHVLRYTDQQLKPSAKATYRKALAQFHVKQYDEAVGTLMKIDFASSKECTALHKQIVQTRRKEENQYNSMVKNMFA